MGKITAENCQPNYMPKPEQRETQASQMKTLLTYLLSLCSKPSHHPTFLTKTQRCADAYTSDNQQLENKSPTVLLCLEKHVT